MSINRVLNTLESGEVLRYHAAPGVTKQTDAHHAWGVAVLALHIVGPDISATLLKECLLHDSGELVTGDIPFTAKRYDPELGDRLHAFEADARRKHMIPNWDLTWRETAILKICDTLEGFVWCYKEESQKGTPGFHRGQVWLRWQQAYLHARQKFCDFLSPEEWARADAVFVASGGPESVLESLNPSSTHA